MTADTPDATAQDIAGRLSPAERAALLWLPADGAERAWLPEDGIQVGHMQLRVDDLARSRVDRRSQIRMRRSSPLGQRVRAILAAERDDGEPPHG